MINLKQLVPGDKVVLVTERGRVDLTRIFGRYKYRVAADYLPRPALANVFSSEERLDRIEVRLESGVRLREHVLKLAYQRS
ncbi:MAG TPA: hypothetical protein VGL40_01785 [Bacillota bacterium]